MAVVVHSQDYRANATEILVFPDHYVAVAQTFLKDDAAAVTVGDRKIIPQGTVYPTNDANALGVLFHDVDVTDNDVTAKALLIHGFLKKSKLPADISAAARAVLPMLAVMPLGDKPY